MEAVDIERIKASRRGARSGPPMSPNSGAKDPAAATRKPSTIQSPALLQLLEKALASNLLFKHLDDEQRRAVRAVMFDVATPAGKIIIKQGDAGDNFYVLVDGECAVSIEGKGEVARVKPGGSFGELALMYNAPRAATVTAATDCKLLAIDQLDYRRMMMNTTLERRKKYEGFLKKVPLLSELNDWERATIADVLMPVSFGDAENVITEGDAGNEFFVVVDGSAVAVKEDKVVMEYSPGDYFGELALLSDVPRQATVKAKGPLRAVKFDREAFTRVLGPCEDILRRNAKKYDEIMARVKASK